MMVLKKSTATDAQSNYSITNIQHGSCMLYCDGTDNFSYEPRINYAEVNGKNTAAGETFVRKVLEEKK
jgi:hypothetical protein